MATPRKKPPQVPPRDPGALVAPGDDWRQPVDPGGGLILTDDEIEPPPQTAADRIASMMQSAGAIDRATVKLYKVLDPATKKLGSCRDYSPEEFEAGGIDMIRKHWGPGEYVAYLYGDIGGTYGRRAATTVTVLEDRGAALAPSATGDPAMTELLRTLAQGQQQMLQALTARPDSMGNMRDMLGLMVTMREAMGLAGQAPQGGGSAIKQLTELAGAMKLMRELGGEFAGDKPPSDPLTDALPGVLDLVRTAVGARQAPQPGTDTLPVVHVPDSFPTIAPPDAAQSHHAPTQENPPMPQVNDAGQLVRELTAQLQTLVGLAQMNVDPEIGADVVLDKAPDEVLDILHDAPQWFEQLAQFAPAVKPHEAWFRQVRDLVVADMDAPDEGDDQAGAAPAATVPAPSVVVPIVPTKPKAKRAAKVAPQGNAA
jgi:hypothetical protein